MTPDRLLAHFDRISEAPDAISRLRRLVLDLAVRGKLVDQHEHEEHASALISRIAAVRKSSDLEVRKRSSPLSPSLQFDWPFDIPQGWEWARFADVASIQSKLVDPRDHQDASHIAPDNIERGTGRLLPFETIRAAGVSSPKHLFYPGCILYSKIRPALSKVVTIDFEGLCSADMYPIQALINREYLHKYMLSAVFVKQATRDDTRVAMPKINQAALAEIQVAVPPLAEQLRIVARVNELMALCDRLEAAQAEREQRRDRLVAASLHHLSNAEGPTQFREQARFHLTHLPRLTTCPEHIKRHRQVIYDLAVQGSLVTQDPEEEPASAALSLNDQERRRIAESDRRAESGVQTLLAAEDRWPVPTTWNWRALADLALFIDYRGNTPNKVTEGVRLITAKNVKNGNIQLTPEEFLTEPDYHTWMRRGFPRNGDVLFTTEAPLGNVAVVRDLGRFALAQRLICFRLYGALAPDFLVVLLLSTPFRLILDKTATGMTAKGIKAAKLKCLPIAVPPLAEQHRIVARVNELMALCDQLQSRITSTAEDSRRLLEVVLQEALAGAA